MVQVTQLLIRNNIYLLYAYKLIRLTKSAGLGCIFIPDGNSYFFSALKKKWKGNYLC